VFKRIIFFLVFNFLLIEASTLHFTISELSGLRLDYEKNMFVESTDGFSQLIISVIENSDGEFIYADNILKEEKKCTLIQKTDEYIAFLLTYPEAIWTFAIYPNKNIAYVSVQRVLINANALLMHGRVKTVIK